MRIFWYDLFILSCLYLDVNLGLLLVENSLKPFGFQFGFLVIPVAFFIVSGSALLANRMASMSKTQKHFRFKETMVVLRKKKDNKEPSNRKRVMRPLESAKPKVEFGFHTCPVHGVEKCAGNYLDLHACNDTVQTSGKQIFWKEITPAVPAK